MNAALRADRATVDFWFGCDCHLGVPAPSPTPILRMVHIGCLPFIISDGCQYSRNQAHILQRVYPSIANSQIVGHRGATAVPCGAGGTVNDYVPFYFAPRSPMLYALMKGNVPNVTVSQDDIVYLVSSAQAVAQACAGFVFTDGHSIMTGLTDFFDDLQHLKEIDWPLMAAHYWGNTTADPDRTRRRQAEFLVRDSFPWALVHEVVVKTAATGAAVSTAMAGASHLPPVRVDPSWYF